VQFSRKPLSCGSRWCLDARLELVKDRPDLEGWASGVCGAVWDTGAVHRALGRASLARRFCVFWLWRAAGLALKAHPRVYECGSCHRQESVTAGTVFHRTRTDLSKWFVAAYLMGRDKRGVSAKFLQRELAVAYQTAWTMAQKLRHGLSEDPARPLRGFLEADETFIGGRGDPTSRGRSTASPDKSLVVAAVEKVPAPKNQEGKSSTASSPATPGSPCCHLRPQPSSAPS
jgi:hypothetical protein